LPVEVAALVDNRGYVVALGFTGPCEVLQLYINGLSFPLETEVKGTIRWIDQEEMIVFEDGSLDFFALAR
jgi:hypothetical protein